MRHSSRDSYFGQPRHGHGRPVSAQHATQYRKISTTSMSDQKRQPQTRAEKASQGFDNDTYGNLVTTSPSSK
ncbi:hypothetical protein E3N88_44515 [Mikania micrantha]|uniref:Uncharacterized protein n=1 Tax=Mikania micrantha TaxID=192012 RepID=A0A5N6LBT4_9ASTR|nr:hypothetical protein E3N88_44515 [Mikania micrantha]